VDFPKKKLFSCNFALSFFSVHAPFWDPEIPPVHRPIIFLSLGVKRFSPFFTPTFITLIYLQQGIHPNGCFLLPFIQLFSLFFSGRLTTYTGFLGIGLYRYLKPVFALILFSGDHLFLPYPPPDGDNVFFSIFFFFPCSSADNPPPTDSVLSTGTSLPGSSFPVSPV